MPAISSITRAIIKAYLGTKIRPLAKIRKYPETICVNRCLSARYLRLLYDSKISARGLFNTLNICHTPISTEAGR
jgi:hypothetical protein